MNKKIKELKGANMNIDLTSNKEDIVWEQDECPWNKAEKTDKHKCVDPHFCGIKYLYTVFCSYPHKNPNDKENTQ